MNMDLRSNINIFQRLSNPNSDFKKFDWVCYYIFENKIQFSLFGCCQNKLYLDNLERKLQACFFFFLTDLENKVDLLTLK